ncbi:bacteriocin biosynthesis cyclodehydratase domain-containing protein [Leifsonia sp. AK011]|uniref:hypothetical protein n=1 Tax=Leifsonia sp. AK011 TaxID=2723075 RepID=UPI0015C9C123|nr:hypothetical protein [Leifsonia sp. AK011]NYF10208.1 bacteriocin biosynthesis cyclodehydratase domain-containing protein [Leifsonia sp. AK011]
MTIRIDPRWPLVWRDPHTLQVGIDPPRVVLRRVSVLEERLVSAMSLGIMLDGLDVLAGGNHAVVVDLLDRLAPVLQAPVPRSRGTTVAVSGAGRFVDLGARLLGEAGIRVLVSEDPASLVAAAPTLAIVVGHGVLAPRLHSVWLRRDVPHLPVLFTESAVHLGPCVEPGIGPCLACIELHRRDADPAWPTIATQLLARPRRTEPPALATEAAAALCRMVMERLENGPVDATALRISVSGERSRHPWTVHPECSCGGLESAFSRELTGTDSASGQLAIPQSRPPTTVQGSAGRA